MENVKFPQNVYSLSMVKPANAMISTLELVLNVPVTDYFYIILVKILIYDYQIKKKHFYGLVYLIEYVLAYGP